MKNDVKTELKRAGWIARVSLPVRVWTWLKTKQIEAFVKVCGLAGRKPEQVLLDMSQGRNPDYPPAPSYSVSTWLVELPGLGALGLSPMSLLGGLIWLTKQFGGRAIHAVKNRRRV